MIGSENSMLRLLFQFDTEYLGTPKYITGNAFRHAVSKQVNVSFGMFTEKNCLERPKTYKKFFEIRTEPTFLIPHVQTFFSRVENEQKHLIFFTPTHVTFDVINPPDDFLNQLNAFHFLQFGGLRNEGFGACRLVDHVKIDVNEMELPKKATHLTYISPVKYLPKYVEPYRCREEQMQLWSNNKLSNVRVLSAGQFFRLNDRRTIEKIALDGMLRRNLLGKFGFGEFLLNDWEDERPEKQGEPLTYPSVNEPKDAELLDIQKHDLHKLRIRGFKSHKEALTEPAMKRADGVASWFSRNSEEKEFDMENRFYLRDSYVLDLNKKHVESQIVKKQEEIFKIFSETDPTKLHDLILKSKLLNKFSESRVHPYSSYKYHVLLTCSLYWNFYRNNKWEQLYLTDDEKKIKSIYQIIYRDEDRVWTLTSEPGMSRVSPKFCETWVRRTKLAIGGDHVLDGLLSQIASWSEALATIEDWQQLHG